MMLTDYQSSYSATAFSDISNEPSINTLGGYLKINQYIVADNFDPVSFESIAWMVRGYAVSQAIVPPMPRTGDEPSLTIPLYIWLPW